ncbi:Golgi apparatus membrane protein TVP23 [Ephemerocybe angulata]|uniref:Golgi apparatus membrane protein TVP23 n=1 Tax=Ephemerocybe angulata TaxID=980116 RepID=A0A8H6IKL2_9AGAR|nr:Golgi apparatus membrane protein TVP23 [Tulosesus angulatus]
MSVAQPLLATIEPDEPALGGTIDGARPKSARPPPEPIVLTPTNRSTSNGGSSRGGQGQMATTEGDAESGIAGIFRQSAHPLALFFLYFFKLAAILVYILYGWFTDNYVLSTVGVVILLAMDFWNSRNVAGRTLVGLRFWNQVDEDGESYWVFESRDPSRPANPIDSKLPSTSSPCSGAALLIVAILKLGFTSVPIVILALVFNVTNVIGFTYARKTRWANNLAGGSWGALGGLGGIGGQLVAGAVKRGVGKVFG